MRTALIEVLKAFNQPARWCRRRPFSRASGEQKGDQNSTRERLEDPSSPHLCSLQNEASSSSCTDAARGPGRAPLPLAAHADLCPGWVQLFPKVCSVPTLCQECWQVSGRRAEPGQRHFKPAAAAFTSVQANLLGRALSFIFITAPPTINLRQALKKMLPPLQSIQASPPSSSQSSASWEGPQSPGTGGRLLINISSSPAETLLLGRSVGPPDERYLRLVC